MLFDTRLARLCKNAVGTYCVNCWVVCSVVIVKNIPTVVDDRILCACNPVTLRSSTCSVEIGISSSVVRFDEEDVQLICSFRTIRVVQFFKNTTCVVAPARSAPRCRKV